MQLKSAEQTQWDSLGDSFFPVLERRGSLEKGLQHVKDGAGDGTKLPLWLLTGLARQMKAGGL